MHIFDLTRIFGLGCPIVAERDESAFVSVGISFRSTPRDLLAAILRLTLPKGIGPFVEKLTALGGILEADAAPSATAPASKLRKPSTR
jgi:hypothetical protein